MFRPCSTSDLIAAGVLCMAACVGEIGTEPDDGCPQRCVAGCLPEALCNNGVDDDCDGLTDCNDDDCTLDPACFDPTLDSDGDGLPDAWEQAAGDETLLDKNLADTDSDSTPDSQEDPDNDGLTNLEELALLRLSSSPPTPAPHPLRIDLIIELDAMVGRELSGSILGELIAAYAALPNINVDASTGVQAHIYVDERQIPEVSFSGGFNERWSFFAAHGPTFTDRALPLIPYDQMIHVIVAKERLDMPARTGEAVPDYGGSIANTGVFVFYDAVDAAMPSCGAPTAVPPLPDIELDEALASTLVHEVGHTLQIGHDTSVGGGTNYWNVMSVPGACSQAQMRFHGVGNLVPALGNTESISAPRFSDAAAALMDFTFKLSVDTPDLNDVDM